MNIKDIIKAAGFRYNKALGQNFITDGNLLSAIVADAGVSVEDTVLEIGTGAGTLTRALSQKAGRVVSFEVDKNLEPVLSVSLSGVDNAEVVFRDVLKMSDSEISEIAGESFKVVANLPYYITTPLIMRFLESGIKPESMTVMVQKEVADRLVAKPSSPDYAALTLAVETYGEARVTRAVPRSMFYPSPNVDSAVVRIDHQKDKLSGENAPLIRKLIRAVFSMRRKTLANNLCAAFCISKDEAAEKIRAAGFPPMIRGEALSLADYVKLSRLF